MVLSRGDLLYPFFTVLKNDELQIRLLGFITVKRIKLSTLSNPYRTSYKTENIVTYFKYFSILVCWKNKLKKPVYKIEALDRKTFILVRLTDRKLLTLRTYMSRVKIKSKANFVDTNDLP